MKVYRELEIRGDAGALKATLDGIKKTVSGYWMVVEDQETLPGPPQHGFACERTSEHPAATLWLVEKPGQLYVSNIIPSQGEPHLSEDEYNAIAAEFYERFVIPVAKKTDVQKSLSPPEVSIEKWMSPDTAQLLRRFSVAANKSTGSSHPLDEERWFAFITATHREGASLDASTLERWLREEEGWPEDVASELAVEYEKARSLLNFCDQAA